jgi:hypothetical protein
LGPSLCGPQPKFRELVGFGGVLPKPPSIEGSSYSVCGAGAAPEAVVGPQSFLRDRMAL